MSKMQQDKADHTKQHRRDDTIAAKSIPDFHSDTSLKLHIQK